MLKGAITGYEITPVAAQGNEKAALNRLTITVDVEFTNSKNDKQSWHNSFQRFADFSSSTNISTIETQLIDNINQQLTEDIFNKAVVNW